jgi:hypothetical protein
MMNSTRSMLLTLLTMTVSIPLASCGSDDPQGCEATELSDGSVSIQCGDQDPVVLTAPDETPGQPGEQGARGERGPRGDAGTAAAIRIEEASPQQCPFGGSVVFTGLDLDASGSLEPGEESQNFIVCQGAPGDGKTALVTSSQAALSDCPDGGTRVEVGLDEDESGTLDPEEIIDAFDICDGAPGAPGADGARALIEVTLDAATGCADGGDVVTVGVDADGDGTLTGAEATGTFSKSAMAPTALTAPTGRRARSPTMAMAPRPSRAPTAPWPPSVMAPTVARARSPKMATAPPQSHVLEARA